MDEKIMQFANFNITFGDNNAPMLDHFEDIIFPAFTGDYFRGKKGELPRYSFDNVAIRDIDGEYVLVGNYVKDMEYKVITTFQEGMLVDSPAEVPTAPYSRFIIFLKNHRMILVRNENESPDIRSFQKTVHEILNQFIREKNREREKDKKLPVAIVHIVDIPMKEKIEEVLSTASKINWLKLRFFPLNNDLDPIPLGQAVKDDMQKMGSKTGNIVFNSPSKINGVKEVLEATRGMSTFTMQVTDSDGGKRKLKQESFSTSTKIQYNGNVNPNGDMYLIDQAKKNEVINKTSEDNANLYERMKAVIRRLMS